MWGAGSLTVTSSVTVVTEWKRPGLHKQQFMSTELEGGRTLSACLDGLPTLPLTWLPLPLPTCTMYMHNILIL